MLSLDQQGKVRADIPLSGPDHDLVVTLDDAHATLHIPPGPYDSALRLLADGLAVTGRRAGAVAAHPAPGTGTD